MRMVAFLFGDKRCAGVSSHRWTIADECNRGVFQIMDHMLISVESFSSAKLDASIFLTFVVVADDKQAGRIESLS